ncbi:MAG: hypothetical protein QW372_02155 [Nitrososphaerales archaeon]
MSTLTKIRLAILATIIILNILSSAGLIPQPLGDDTGCDAM